MNANLIKKFVLPSYDYFCGRMVIQHLELLHRTDKMSGEELLTLQNTRLEKLLVYAHKNIETYKQIDRKQDVREWLQSFPIITKEFILEQGKSLLTIDDLKAGGYHRTGGTTGVPSNVYMTHQEYSTAQATQLHWLSWLGYSLGDRILQMGIGRKRPLIKQLKDIILNTDYFQLHDVNHGDFCDLFRRNDKHDEVFLMGYPNVINEMVEDYSMESNHPSIKGILSFGEKLPSYMKNHIESKMNSRIIETYGAAEGMMIASQKDHEFLYIMSPNVVVEIVDDEGNLLNDGEIGNVVVTNLNTYSMPLIRYKIGDLGVILPRESYPKKREMEYPLLKKIIGRENDFIKTPEGRLFNIFSIAVILSAMYQNILQYQIIQNEIDEIQIHYVLKGDIDLSEEIKKQIVQKLIIHFKSERMKIAFMKKAKLIHYRSGKIQLIIRRC